MCGRFALAAHPQALRVFIGLSRHPPLVRPDFDLRPTRRVAVARQAPDGTRLLHMLRWGLVPRWARDPREGRPLINARAETLFKKPSFRDAARFRRCILPASGFYEWKSTGRSKQSYLFRPRDGGLLAMAGLWEHWDPPVRAQQSLPGTRPEPLESCTIVTTAANLDLDGIHHRMPLLLDRRAMDLWLDPALTEEAHIIHLLHPPREGLLQRTPTSPRDAHRIFSMPPKADPAWEAPLNQFDASSASDK